MEDELEALYGSTEPEQAPASVPQPVAPADDDSLFVELYGEALQDEGEKAEAAAGSPCRRAWPLPLATCITCRRPPRRTCLCLAGPQPTSIQPVAPAIELGADAASLYDGAPIEEDAAPASTVAAQAAGSDDDDDLVISLDENAAAYEPTAGSRFQYQRQAPAAHGGGTAPMEAVGMAPGQHEDISAAPAVGMAPGLPGFGGFGGRPAIGGIPRSAIPGLGGSMVTSVPSAPAGSQAAAPSVGGPSAAPAAAAAGPGPPGRPSFRPTLRCEAHGLGGQNCYCPTLLPTTCFLI